jgi:glycosyltransferase involved in cell wall biosynthesis
VRNLILALAQIAHDVPFIALVCGDGPRRQYLERLARELGIAHRVVFTGYVSNIWTLMKGADAFASLSRFEGCPNVVIEAMACGCPLVVSDIPAHREILDGKAASFVDPDNPAEVARAIKAVLNDGTAARVRAKAALANMAEWKVEQIAQLYKRVYHGVSRAALLEDVAPAAMDVSLRSRRKHKAWGVSPRV